MLAQERLAAIVREPEAAVGGGWLDYALDDEGDLPEGMSTLSLGAAGMIWCSAAPS